MASNTISNYQYANINDQISNTIKTIITEELKNLLETIDHRATKIHVDKWAETKLLPTLETNIITGLQLKDKLTAKNKIIISAPISENPTVLTVTQRIHKIIDPQNTINSDIIVGCERIPASKNNNNPNSPTQCNFKIILPSKDQLEINNQPCIKTLFSNLTDYQSNTDISNWKISTDTPAYARRHKKELNHFAYLIRQNKQGNMKTSTKLKYSVKDHKYFLQIKSKKTNNKWVDLDKNLAHIPNKLIPKYKETNASNFYLVQESNQFYDIYKAMSGKFNN